MSRSHPTRLRMPGTSAAGLRVALLLACLLAAAAHACQVCIPMPVKTLADRLLEAGMARGEAARLVDRGPYRLVRHPIYLAVILGALGLALAFLNTAAVVVALVFIGAMQLFGFVPAIFFPPNVYGGNIQWVWDLVQSEGEVFPVADKLIVAVALVMLVQANPKWWFVIPAAVIVGREIAISALREWMAEIGERAQVAVSVIGKIKTTAQMIALLLLLYGEPLWALPTRDIGIVLLYVAATLTLWSMVIYLRAAWPVLSGNEKS